jgi:acyl-coenzyme A thioesterase 13
MDAPNGDYFEILKSAFHTAPITQLIPQTMIVPEEGKVTITLHADARHHHGAGRIHGGILALLLDNAGFFACATVTGGYWVATTEFKINLLESVALEDVVATGRVLRKGRSLLHAQMEAHDARGGLAAVALGSYAILPRKFRAAASP